jgi:hypothetical protein
MISQFISEFFRNFILHYTYELMVYLIYCNAFSLQISKRKAYRLAVLYSAYASFNFAFFSLLIGGGVIPETNEIFLMNNIFMLLEQLVVLVFAIQCFELPWYKTYWLTVVAHTILGLPMVLAYNGTIYYNSNNDALMKPMDSHILLIYVLALTVMIIGGCLLIFLCRHFKKIKKKYHMPKWCWVIVNGLWVIQLLTTRRSYHQNDPNASDGLDHASEMDELFILIVIMVIIFYIISNYSDRKLLKVENKLLKKQNEIQYANYIAMQQQELQIHKLYHDIGNHIKTIQLLVSSGDTKEAKAYTDELEQLYRGIRKNFYCNNKIINAVLSEKSKICEQNRISCEIEVNLKEDLPYRDIDLMCIFSNLFDNAIEGCKRNSSSDNYIHVKSSMVGDYLAIKFINTKPEAVSGGKEKGSLITWKKDKSMHGYGLRIVEEIVERYEGQKEFADHDKEYSAMVMLKYSSVGFK